MSNNLKRDFDREVELDLNEIINLLFESKRIIIICTLIFTLLTLFFVSKKNEPFYHSQAVIEIGKGHVDLIQPAASLIKDLNVQYDYKELDHTLSFSAKETKLIIINSTSNSAQKNIDSINSAIKFIDEKHKKIVEEESYKLGKKIDNLDNKIQTLVEDKKLKLITLEELNKKSNENSITKIQFRLDIINQDIPYIEKKIELLKLIIEEDEENLNLLKASPELFLIRTSEPPTMNQILHNYKINLIELQNSKASLELERISLETEMSNLKSNESVSKYSLEISQLKNLLNKINNEGFIPSEIIELNSKKTDLTEKFEKIYQNQTKSIGEIQTRKKVESIEEMKYVIVALGFFGGFFAGVFIVLLKNIVFNQRVS